MLQNFLRTHLVPNTEGSVPGPRFYSPFEFSREMMKDPFNYLGKMKEEYGDIVKLPVPFKDLYLVTDADLIGKVLLGTEKSNTKSLGYRRIKPLLGEGLVTSVGELWKTQRRLSNPAFHQKVINGFFDVIQDETLVLVEELKERVVRDPLVDISAEMSRLTFTVIVRVLFSMNMKEKAAEVREALIELQHYANYLFYSLAPLPLGLPTPNNKRIRKCLAVIDDIVYGLIESHRQYPERYDDLLSVYLASRDEDTGEGMSDKLVRDEVVTLMLAGHDTTAVSIAFALELLARHPYQRERLQQEYAALPPGRLSLADLAKLEITGQVFSETMRLYPAAWAIGRELTEDMEFKGYHLKTGSLILCTQYLTHRHKKYWKNPETFQPERFSVENSKGRHPFAYFPFGGGQRTCIGSNLAKLEAVIILSTLLRNFKMNAVDDMPYKIHPRITLVLDPGIKLRLSPLC